LTSELFFFFYFLQDQKVAKNLGFVKIAKNRRAILVKRNEVETVFLFVKPMYTNLLCIATLSRRVSSFIYAACFLNAIFTRPVLLRLILTDYDLLNIELDIPKHCCPVYFQIKH